MSARVELNDWIDEVSIDNAMDVTANIAQWVRLSGTDDERRAFDYIAETLRGYGLRTTLHEPTCLVSLPLAASLTVNDVPYACITHAFSTATPEAGVAGELVYAAGGTEAELAGVGATGKIALTDGLASPGKAYAASKVGVRALICISGEQIHEMIVSPVWGSPTPETLEMLPTVPVVSVDADTGERLKQVLSDGRGRAQVRTEVDTRWRPIPVLIADLDVDGRDYVLFSGHVDSWHYGAMDNGSANATMVEVGRILAGRRDQLRRGLRLAFWSGHSHARYAGSTWFADAYWFELRERCVAHVNVDSTGGIGATDLTTANTMAETYELARSVIGRQTDQQLIYQRFGRAGDQSFWGIGLPAVFMSLSHQGQASGVAHDLVRLTGGTAARSGGLGWWWHTTEDTLDKISPEYLERDTKVYVEVVGLLTTSPALPIDVRATIVELQEALKEIEPLWGALPRGSADDEQGFDMLRAELTATLDAATRLQVRLDDPQLNADDAERVSRQVVNACKWLMPANYTSNGAFEHDLALGAVSLPALRPSAPLIGLSDDELWAASHKLRRALNAARFGVQQARSALESEG